MTGVIGQYHKGSEYMGKKQTLKGNKKGRIRLGRKEKVIRGWKIPLRS